jgi:hypothetical protein
VAIDKHGHVAQPNWGRPKPPKPLPLGARESDEYQRIMRDYPLFLTWWDVEGERLFLDWSKHK